MRSARCVLITLIAIAGTGVFLSQSLPQIDPAKTWAVVIGISNYTSEDVQPLQYAASDAQAMAEFLMSPRGGSLRPDKIEVLLEGEATAEAIRTTLGFLGDKVATGDSVYIFVAGHGFLTPRGLGYFIPSDGRSANVYASAVNFREMKELVEENLAHTKVRILMTDVCHAGLLATGSGQPSPNRINEYISQFTPKAGTFLNLLASRPDEYSFESDTFAQGVFTHAILDGLNGKATAAGGVIADTRSVVEFVKSEVPRLTANQQNPMSNANFDPNLALAFLDRPGPAAMPAVQTSLVIRNTNRVTFDSVQWFDSRYRARGTRRFPKDSDVVQINNLPVGEMEFKFTEMQNPTRSLKLTLKPGENVLDILGANLTRYRFIDAGPVQVAALQPSIPSTPVSTQLPVAASMESILLLKAPVNASIQVDGATFATSTAADEYIQLTGLTPGLHNLKLASPEREYRFRLRLVPGSQTFDVQSGELRNVSAPQDPASVPVPAGLPANLVNAYRNFTLALWDSRLVQPQGNSAWDFFSQMRNGLPPQLREQLTERLIIAMGNRAQQTILRYLRGGDIQWSAGVFDEGAALSDRMQQLFQFRPATQRDIQSRQNFFTGRALIARGRYAEAIQQLQRSIDLFAEASHSFNAIGLGYWKQGLLEQAIPPLQQAIALTPRWTYPQNLLALVLFELRRYDEAQQTFQQALLVSPEDSSLTHGFAQLDLQLGRVADAEMKLQRAIEFNPGNAYAHDTYGRLERLRGNLGEAERLIRLAIRLEPDEPSFRASLADLLRQRGQAGEARQIFTQLARTNPSDLSVVRPYTAMLAAENRIPEARAVFEQALKAAPKDGNLHVAYAEFLRMQRRESEAEKQYKEALSASSNAFAHYGLANVYLSQGKLPQAEREIQAATKADPRYPRSMVLLGQIRSGQKRYDEALDAYNKALALAVEPDLQQEVKQSIEEAKKSAAMAAIQAAKQDIDKNRLKSAWTTYAGALKVAPGDPALVEALLKFENDFAKDADTAILPASAIAAVLRTSFWTNLRAAEAVWKSGSQADGLRSFADSLETLSTDDRRKVIGTDFNNKNENYGIHQIVYRWASRAVDLRDFTGAQRIMDAALRHKIFDFVPGVPATTLDSLMIPSDGPEPTTFAGFDVAHHPDVRAHEVLALIFAGQGNTTKAEEYLPALTTDQRTEVLGKIQRLTR